MTNRHIQDLEGNAILRERGGRQRGEHLNLLSPEDEEFAEELHLQALGFPAPIPFRNKVAESSRESLWFPWSGVGMGFLLILGFAVAAIEIYRRFIKS